ncbi:hypothetical protein T02_16006 [Trichinella nativa]|uniref:Secreted protein n=1 Tax=Trichinella nativa TaxID=6335 RepID=A0A0V1LQV1_9BILA|nr:hypothetical protein T02_16006 [Trichinella nativa]
MSWSLAICVWTTLPTVGNVCFDNDTSRPPYDSSIFSILCVARESSMRLCYRAGQCKNTLAYDEPPNRWRYPSLSRWTGVVTTETTHNGERKRLLLNEQRRTDTDQNNAHTKSCAHTVTSSLPPSLFDIVLANQNSA